MNRLLTVILAAATICVAGARNIADFFVAAPVAGAAPYLDTNMRLDMLDYFRSNLPSKTVNFFEESAGITAESERTLKVDAAPGVELQYGLAVAGPDSLIVVIETLPLPMADSRVCLFRTDWAPAAPAELTVPLEAWLTDEGRRRSDRVADLLPFMCASAEFVDDGNKLVLTNTIADYFTVDDEARAELAAYLRPQLTYIFNGKTFVAPK